MAAAQKWRTPGDGIPCTLGCLITLFRCVEVEVVFSRCVLQICWKPIMNSAELVLQDSIRLSLPCY